LPARKKHGSRTKETPKILSTSKVLRVVEKLGSDPAKFLKLYAEDRTRTRKETAPPSSEQIAAVAAFKRNGDVPALMKRAGVKSPGAALNLVGRVSRHATKGNS